VANLTYSQLEQLWIQAGGSPTLAPYAAATAIVESGGDPTAYNASGATGLWQIEYPGSDVLGYSSAQLDNPLDNAKAAVALSKNTMAGLLSNWTAYEPAGAAAAIVKQNGGKIPSSTTTTASTTTTGSGTVQGIQGNVPGVSAPGATASGAVSSGSLGSAGTIPDPSAPGGLIGFTEGLPLGIGNLFKAIEPLLHAVATVIDYSFAVFQPGQGQRALFALGALILAFLSYRVMAGSGSLPFPKVGAV